MFTEDDFKAVFGKGSFSGLAARQQQEDEERKQKERYKAFLAGGGEVDPETGEPVLDAPKKTGDWLKDAYTEGGFGGFLAGGAGLAKDAAPALWEGFTSAYKRTGEGLGEIVGEATGANQQIRDNYAKIQQENIETVRTAGSKMKDQTLSPEERAKWRKVYQQAANDTTGETELGKYNEEQLDKTDPIKNAAAAAEIGLDIATLGAIKTATTGAKAVTKGGRAIGIANKVLNPTGIKQGIASGVTLGSVQGALGTVEMEGDESTLGSVATGAGTGALIGAGLGGALGGVGKLIGRNGKVADEAPAAEEPTRVDLTDEDIPQQLRERALANGTGFVPEGKTIVKTPEAQKQLPATRETPEEIAKQLDDLAQGNYSDDLFDITTTDGVVIDPAIAQQATQKQLSILEKRRSELQAQMDDVSGSIHQSVSGGKPTLNVGMNVGDKKGLTATMIRKALKDNFGIKVRSAKTHMSDSEPTYIPELSREMTPDEVAQLSEILQQDAIAHHTGKGGLLAGPKAEEWGGEFNPEFYLTQDGAQFSSRMAEGDQGALRGKLGESVAQLDSKMEGLRTGDSSALSEVFGEGSQRSINADRLRDRFKELRERYTVAQNQSVADQRFVEENTFTGSNRTPAEIDADLEAVKNDIVPESVKVERPDFESTVDVAEAIPALAPQVDELMTKRMTIQRELEDILTPDKAETAKNNAGVEYEAKIAALEGMPDLRKKYERQTIDADYLAALTGIDEDLANVGPRGTDLQKELDSILAQEQDLVMKANFVKSNNPDNFKVIDAEQQANLIVDLEKDKFINTEFPDADDANNVIVNTARRTEGPEQFAARIDHDAAVKKAYDQKVDSMMSMTIKTSKPGANILGTPLNILKQWGQRGQAMADELLDAHFNFARSRGEFIDKAKDWHDILKSAGDDSTTKVFRSLDGENVDLNPAEANIRGEIREYLDAMGERLGLTDKTRVSEYIPHMFEQTFGRNYNELEKIVATIRYGVDEAGKKISADEKALLAKQLGNVDAETLAFIRSNTSWKIKNGHLEQRTGAEGYSQDLFKVLSSYDNIANKKIHYEPAMKVINAVSGDLLTEQKEYLNKFFSRIKGDHSSIFEDSMDRFIGEGNTARVLSTQRRLSNASIMGASPLTWVKNLQDTAKVFADRPAKHVIAAIPDAIRAMRYGSEANRELFRNGIMESNMAQFLKGMSADTSTAKNSGARNAVLKGESALWSGMRAVDAFTRSLNYRASISEFMEKNPGGSMDDAIRFAQETNRDTVFTFSDLDIPVALNNSMGRSTLNMQTYNLQTAKYIMKHFGDVLEKSPDGKYRMSKPGMIKMSKYVAANMAFMASAGAALGLEPYELVPFGSEFEGGKLPQSPLVAQLIGNEYQKGLVPTAGNTVGELFNTVFRGDSSKLGEAVAESGEAVGNFAMSHIPARTQFNRTKGGIESTNEGFARSNSGNIQFGQSDNKVMGLPIDAMMAAVFGKNTTEAGKQWVDDGRKTLSPEQMRLGESAQSGMSIDALPETDKRLYVEMYNALNTANPYDFDTKKDRRETVLADARAAAKEGNANKVHRLINQYNQQAGAKVGEFTGKYGAELPEPMLEQIDSIFIHEDELMPSGWEGY